MYDPLTLKICEPPLLPPPQIAEIVSKRNVSVKGLYVKQKRTDFGDLPRAVRITSKRVVKCRLWGIHTMKRQCRDAVASSRV